MAANQSSVLGSLRQDHPRLQVDADGFAALTERVAQDSTSAAWYARIGRSAESYLNQTPVQYERADGLRLLPVSRLAQKRVYALALMHHVDGDPKWAERAWRELEAVAAFPDWNPVHFLDTAEMAHAVAVGYDWLYHALGPDRRDVLRSALVRHAYGPGLDHYRGNPLPDAVVRNWHNTTTNWNLVCNGGLGMAALAIGDEEPEPSEEILAHALAGYPKALSEYAPSGGYPEGVGSYWPYATRYVSTFLASLQSALGTDHGLSQQSGLDRTGDFPIHLTGPSGIAYNYYDSGPQPARPASLLWLAGKYDNPLYGWWGKQGGDADPDPQHLLWFDPGKVASPTQTGESLDRYFEHAEVVTSRSAWEDRDALFVGFKAGDNQTNHGDLDVGSFVLDALGQRWASELGSANYNLPGYFDSKPGGRRWLYYRKRAEGQNTLLINPSTAPGQNELAKSRIIAFRSSPSSCFAVADITDAYPGQVRWAYRGFTMPRGRRQVLLQDEFALCGTSEVWWFMHTSADITVSRSGRTALLQQQGKYLEARILSDMRGAFCVMNASPLPTSPNPEGQDHGSNGRKLAIRLEARGAVSLGVLFTPLPHGPDSRRRPAAPSMRVTPMRRWR
ncbi:heparinase II/III family protein [Streptomyces sp. NPDC056405]|uniref:heparinase II/III domain-containing protein n=1 Tax=Streptomyces sp. NPDC056405 TaxID=3345811 RepID=UPI0035E02553